MPQSTENDTSNQPETPNYKPQLDEAASRVKDPPPEKSPGIVDKSMVMPQHIMDKNLL
jgi:hypothetical protein